MDTQEAYETMRRWFTNPYHGPGIDTVKNACLYFQDANHKCAVGSILPEKLYKEAIENKAVDDVVEMARFRDFFSNIQLGFLTDAQRAHDDIALDEINPDTGEVNESRFRLRFISKLDEIANYTGLNVKLYWT